MYRNVLTKKSFALVGTAVLCAAAAVIFALCFRPEQGILLSADSLAYLHAADELMRGEGYVYFGMSTPMIQWALLMPTFCALIGLFTADVAGVMVYLNFVFLFVTLLFANLTVKHVIRKPAFALAAQIVISFSWSIWHMYYHLWSEVLFLTFLSMLTYFFVRWLQEDKRRLLVGAGLSACFMLVARFTGMELAGLVGLYILFRRGHSWKKRLGNALIYGLIGAPLCCLTLLRNYIVSGTFTGRSKPSSYTFVTNLKNLFSRIVQWFEPDFTSGRFPVVAIVLLLLLAVSFVLFLALRRRTRGMESLEVPFFLLLHCLLYSATTLYANSTYALDGTTSRIVSPILFCGVTLFFWLLSQGANAKRAWLRGGLIFCALALAIFSAASNVLYVSQTVPGQISYYSLANLGEDPAAEYLSELDPTRVKIWTNDPNRLYYLTGMDCNYIPRRESIAIELYCWDACVERWQETGKELLICWYDISASEACYQEQELQQMLSMTLVADLDNCQIYEAVLP